MLAISDRSAAVWEYSLGQHDLSTLWNSISYDPSSFRDYTDAVQQGKEHYTNAANPINTSNSKDAPAFHTGPGGIGDFRRVLNIKNMSSDGVYAASNVILSSFDNISANHSAAASSSAMSSMKYTALDKELGLSCKPQHILYCLAGHKMFSAFLPSFDLSGRDRVVLGAGGGHSNKEVSTLLLTLYATHVTNCWVQAVEMDELKLNQHYFSDRKGAKLTRSKMQITSAVLLPLRRLLLLGTEEGLVRVIS